LESKLQLWTQPPFPRPTFQSASLLKDIQVRDEQRQQTAARHEAFRRQLQEGLAALKCVEADASALARGQGPRLMHQDTRPLSHVQASSDAAHELKDLYELQRQRMQAEIEALRRERDAWYGSAHTLCATMANKNDMHTLKLLRLRQQTWRHLCLQTILHVHRYTASLLDHLRAAVSDFKQTVGGGRGVDGWAEG
jgi:hypothetical protein